MFRDLHLLVVHQRGVQGTGVAFPVQPWPSRFVGGVVIERVADPGPVEGRAPILSIVMVTLRAAGHLQQRRGLDLDLRGRKPFPSPVLREFRFKFGNNRLRRPRPSGRSRSPLLGAPVHLFSSFSLHHARSGWPCARGRAQPRLEPARRDSRGLDARAGLGAGPRCSAPVAGMMVGAGPDPRAQSDGRGADLRLPPPPPSAAFTRPGAERCWAGLSWASSRTWSAPYVSFIAATELKFTVALGG